jgi:thiol-disulfide isomerase/thioredoxin
MSQPSILASTAVFFESPVDWMDRFRDLVNPEDLQPDKLMARFTSSTAQKLAAKPDEPARRSRSDSESSSLLGKPGPNFELDLLEGGRFELAEQKGKNVVILDFWATWCGPCRAALPGLLEISKEYQNKGVLLRAVDSGEEADTIRAYLKKANFVLSVPLDKDGSVAELYGVSGIPHTVIVGKDGTVQAIHVGYSPENKDRLRRELNDLLAGKPLPREPKK